VNDLKIYANGSGGTAVSTAALPTVSQLTLGSDGTGNFLNGWLRSLDYFPIRAPDAKLGTLTQ
jgi:hypothetical protein